MPRYARSAPPFTYSFGPGPITVAVKWIIWANVAGFVVSLVLRDVTTYFRLFGLSPAAVIEHARLVQPVTYMFLHAGVFHILFNMLGIWMFGVELERLWGTRFFLRYYAVTGIGAALTTILVSLLPFEVTRQSYAAITVGASGALYGLLMVYAIYYPHRPLLVFVLFPIPVWYLVM